MGVIKRMDCFNKDAVGVHLRTGIGEENFKNDGRALPWEKGNRTLLKRLDAIVRENFPGERVAIAADHLGTVNDWKRLNPDVCHVPLQRYGLHDDDQFHNDEEALADSIALGFCSGLFTPMWSELDLFPKVMHLHS